MKWLSGIILVLTLSTINSAPAPFADEGSLRLPKSSIPTNYDITLWTTVDTGERKFTGIVKIDIEIKENSDIITLHNRRLDIDYASVKLINTFTEVEYEISVNEDTAREFVFIDSSIRPLVAGENFRVEISYTGELQLGTSGFYRSSYIESSTTKYLAATQFESTNARAAFICYDEPEYKATFNLKIVHHIFYSAISNTKETVVANGDTTATTTFEETPIMSTYLLAFIVSDFDYISYDNGRLYRMYSRQEDVQKTRYAMMKTAEFLEELEAYAKYTYELTKVDSAAIPDFGAGAMENWGLITYKEQYLIGEENSHPRDVLEIMKTVAHELGHQFFGNVVTCKWWDQIWLNEGFATLFEYLLVENRYPELRFRDYFNVQKLQNAMRSDSLESTRAMLAPAETPSEISGLFDRIAYDKSGTVIRMFQTAVGEEIFRDSLNKYLIDNAHKPVTSDELFKAFEDVIRGSPSGPIGFDFRKAFTEWETQKGFPVIHVTESRPTSNFHITQSRYYAAYEKRVEGDTRSWWIPLNFVSADNPNFDDTRFTYHFESDVASFEMPFPVGFNPDSWYLFNKQQMGYYRVNYDVNNWNELIKVLNSKNYKQIHVLNRAQLIDDSLNLAADGYISYRIAFGILSYLSRETDYIPWRAAVTNLDNIDYILKDRAAHDYYKKFVKRLAKKMFVVYGMKERPEDTLMDKFAREVAIDWTCRMGDEGCLSQMYEILRGSLEELNPVAIPDSLEVSAICHGLKGLDRKTEFSMLWFNMLNSNDQARRLRIIDGLMCSSDPEMLKTLLETSINTNFNYRTHERQRILNNVHIRSSVGLETTASFLIENYDAVVAMYSMSTVDSLVVSMSTRICFYDDQVLLENLMNELEANLNTGTKDRAMTNIDNNKVWVESQKYSDILIHVYDEVTKMENIGNQLRLPKTSIPLHYYLYLDASKVQNGDRTLNGEVEISTIITEETDHVMIHSKTQVIEFLEVVDMEREQIPLLEYSLYPDTDTLTIHFLEELPVGTEFAIHIRYSTLMPTFGSGFYQTSYVIDGVRRWVGSTQFQPTGARYTFPNYDEPEYKAVFELGIRHDPSYSAISNTIGSTLPSWDDMVVTAFPPTPMMSSYLLAFVVSDFGMVSNALDKQPEDTLHRVWVRPDSTSKAWYAVENSEKVLKALEDYLDFPFELSKVDSAAIPAKGGAMENWGMVTYWETAMIYEEKYHDISHALKYTGVGVIAHELAHQFFGDSVTCKWWDETWLNEGFATLFEFHINEVLYPHWHGRHFFNLRKLQNAFRSDSRDVTRAMTSPAETLSEISNIFDTIAYDKSGSVLRMFQNAVGEDIFKAALKLYLEDNNHKSVTAQELIDAFSTIMRDRAFTDFDFANAFRSWEMQKGYPVINVRLNGLQFEIAQERFFTVKKNSSDDTSVWQIPLNYATPGDSNFEDTKFTQYMVDKTAQFAAPADAPQWYIFNKQQLGYYRVNYDFANWHALILVLNSDDYNQIHVLNRAQLVDDTINFAAGGYLDYETTFGILSYLVREVEYTPWSPAERFFNQLYTTFGTMDPDVRKFIRHLTTNLYDNFKLPDDIITPIEEVYERYGREIALRLACNSGNEQCLYDTFIMNYLFLEDIAEIPKGLEPVTYCSGLRQENTQIVWVKMWQLMQSTSDPIVKSRALSALGCSGDQDSLKDYLESTLGSGNSVNYTAAERRSVYTAVLNSYSGLEVVISFLNDFELDILRSFGYANLEALLTVPARTIKTRDQQLMFNDYLLTVTALPVDALGRLIKIGGDNILLQQQPTNANILNIIKAIMAGEDDTTTVDPGITDPPTNPPPTNPPTNPPPTNPPPTNPPPTNPPPTNPPPTNPPPTNPPPTNPSPTNPPPTNEPTNAPPTNLPPTEPTTLGASTIGIKITTLFACFILSYIMKF